MNICKTLILALLACTTPSLQATESSSADLVNSDSTTAITSSVKDRHEQRVGDLAYGTSLFHLFQNEKLAAITDITVAKENGRLKSNPNDAELLLASLYFDYGLAENAENIFSQLLDENISDDVKNRIWFNLARLQYEHNNYTQAEKLLARISDNLSPQREAEKLYISSNLFLQKQNFEQAEKATSSIQSGPTWQAYSEYNLGVKLTAAGETQTGHEWLKKLLTSDSKDKELLSLQDSARLVLGLSLLRQKKFDEALEHFGAIRVSGALSNKALLATGWAWSRKSEPEKALTYWNVLIKKDHADDASLEAPLATAYAYEQLDNKAMAAQSYDNAAIHYELHLQKMDTLIHSIEQNDLINSLKTNTGISHGNFKNNLYNFHAAPYMQHTVTSQSFQQALQNHRDLMEIKKSLFRWQHNLPIYELMLAERKLSFENKRPMLSETTSFKQLQDMQKQTIAFAIEVQRIKDSEDKLALANTDEADYLKQLKDIKSLLTALDGKRDLTDEIEKHRLLFGLLYWDINTDYPRRIWRVSHQLQLLKSALLQAESSARSLKQTAEHNEEKLSVLNQRIVNQRNKIEHQKTQVLKLIKQQEKLLNQLAIKAIDKRKQQLIQLRLNARYSLARVHDEISRQQVVR